MTAVDETFLEHLRAELCAQLTLLQESDNALRSGHDETHGARVSIRRATSTLRVYGDLFDKQAARVFVEELTWYSMLLGNVRDTTLVSCQLDKRRPATVGEREDEQAAWAAIDKALKARERDSWLVLQSGMDDERYDRLRGQLHQWRSTPPLTLPTGRLAPEAETYLAKAASRLDKRLRAACQPEAADEVVHDARKAAERLRYAAELAEPFVGSYAKRLRKRGTTVQKRLGKLQDTSVVIAFLQPIAKKNKVDEGARTIKNIVVAFEGSRSDISGLLGETR